MIFRGAVGLTCETSFEGDVEAVGVGDADGAAAELNNFNLIVGAEK